MKKYIDKADIKVHVYFPDKVDENMRRRRIGEIYNILKSKENELAAETTKEA